MSVGWRCPYLGVKNIIQCTRPLSDAFDGSSGPYNISWLQWMLEPNQSLDHPVFVLFYHSSTIVHKYCRILRSLNFLHHRSISACFFLCILTTMSNTPVHIYNLLLPDDLVRPFFSIYVYCFSFFKPIFIATLYLASLWPIISVIHIL